MKWKLLLLTLGMVLSGAILFAQQDVIIGIWFNQEKDAQIEIFQDTKSQKFYGKIIWLKNPHDQNDKPRTDLKNPKESLRSTPLKGLMILRNFVKNGTEYEDGTIYDPKNGKTYSCVIKVKDNNTIEVRGYIGMSMIGRTTTWKRSN